jgi:AcrR family transcriptional regulator
MASSQQTQAGRRATARTFTERARRAQIVAATIETIAELGFQRASFGQIARRAGLSSTGLITYHFDGRDDLVRQVVADIVSDIAAFMAERMAGVTGPAEALRAYIEGTVEFVAANRAKMKALADIFVNGGFPYGPDDDAAAVSPIEEIMRAGQAAGVFRAFDPTVMATLVQRSVDGLPFLLERQPNLDLAAFAGEVGTVFDLATRAGP